MADLAPLGSMFRWVSSQSSSNVLRGVVRLRQTLCVVQKLTAVSVTLKKDTWHAKWVDCFSKP